MNRKVRHFYLLTIKCVALLTISSSVFASTVRLSLVDQKNKPLTDAVVTFKPLDKQVSAAPISQASIAQFNKEFVPEVSVVRTGTPIVFPNRDPISHHVYSFSKAKTFDLPLYRGTPSEPIVFDTPGLVTLGCNIHDWMRAYVVVVDTPYYKISDNTGSVSLSDIPDGQYELEVWHPRQRKSFSETIDVNAEFSRELLIATKPKFRSRRSASGAQRDYND